MKQRKPCVGEKFNDAEKLIFSIIYLRNCWISDIIYMKQRTVEAHVSNIMIKLGVTTRTAALWTGMKRGYYINDKLLHEYQWESGRKYS